MNQEWFSVSQGVSDPLGLLWCDTYNYIIYLVASKSTESKSICTGDNSTDFYNLLAQLYISPLIW
jgi:hypothetical protein